MLRHWQYLKYVLIHKWHVFRACLQLGVPLWIAIFHDWDKFLPDEWLPYARTFYASNGTKQYQESIAFAYAWMKHQHRNKHHWQYWCNLRVKGISFGGRDAIPLSETSILIWDRGEAQEFVSVRNHREGQYALVEQQLKLVDLNEFYEITCDPMPDVYRREMLADWRGAGAALGMPDTAAWYVKNRDNIKLHPETRLWIEQQLGLAGDENGLIV